MVREQGPGRTLVSIAETYQHAMGRELHDNLGTAEGVVGFQAETLEVNVSTSGSAGAAKVAGSIATQARHAVARCKESAQGLLPLQLETHGLMIPLRSLAKGGWGASCFIT
jgi:glucose-6-phosphate-specific signal transduction histidine kinase